MESEFREGRLYLARSDAERKPLLQRLNRIEGQVRGLRAMIEQDRHCLDEVQQVNAITAAIREVAIEIISQHLKAGLDFAAAHQDGPEVMADLANVIRAGLRQG